MESNNINILIVDDHPVTRKGIVSIIENSELSTTLFEACDGEDAMEHFQKQTIDIALVDICSKGCQLWCSGIYPERRRAGISHSSH